MLKHINPHLTVKSHIIKIMVALAIFSLVACKQENPLKTLGDEQAGKILAQASAKCSRRQGTNLVSGQYDYQHCLEGDKTEINCATLYKDMLLEIKKETKLKNLTIQDLKDKSFFDSIRSSYDRAAFITL